jgi:DNA invertase Pin-like site-specific DNA recombinase
VEDLRRVSLLIGIYCRVSTEKQEDGYSLDLQEAEGIKYATAHGESHKVYRDVESGASAQRLDKIKKDIEDGRIDALWIINIDRLTRLPIELAMEIGRAHV